MRKTKKAAEVRGVKQGAPRSDSVFKACLGREFKSSEPHQVLKVTPELLGVREEKRKFGFLFRTNSPI